MPHARPICITLLPTEAEELRDPSGEGGHQSLHEFLLGQLVDSNLTISLSDEELGKLIRYMTQYGQGGFQGRLSRAFKRPLRALID